MAFLVSVGIFDIENYNEFRRATPLRRYVDTFKGSIHLIQETMKLKAGINVESFPMWNNFKRIVSSRKSFSTKSQNKFLGHLYSCTNIGHKVRDCKSCARDDIRDPYHTSRNKIIGNQIHVPDIDSKINHN